MIDTTGTTSTSNDLDSQRLDSTVEIYDEEVDRIRNTPITIMPTKLRKFVVLPRAIGSSGKLLEELKKSIIADSPDDMSFGFFKQIEQYYDWISKPENANAAGEKDLLLLFQGTEHVHGRIVPDIEDKCLIIQTWHPDDLFVLSERINDTFKHLYKFINAEKFLERQNTANTEINHVFITKLEDLLALQIPDNTEYITCDLETRGFAWESDPITAIGFRYAGISYTAKGSLIETPEGHAKLKDIFTRPNIKYIWQNGKFDIKFMRRYKINARVDEDTMLQAYALDERKGKVGLEYLSILWLNIEPYKGKFDFATISELDYGLHYYNAQDITYTEMVFFVQKERIALEEGLQKVYETVLIPGSEFLAELEINGIAVNLDYLHKLDIQYTKDLADLKNSLTNIAIGAGFDGEEYKTVMEAKSFKSFNPGSTKQLQYLVFNKFKLPKYKQTTTTSIHALGFWLRTQHCPAEVEKIMETDRNSQVMQDWMSISPINEYLFSLIYYRKLKKMHSTYVTSILAKQRNGRIYSTYMITGTATGRLASKDPNMQNIPRRKDVKNIFYAPGDRVFLECDYSQAELRTLAAMTDDPVLVDSYVRGVDLHSVTAELLFGADFTKEDRNKAKTVNFGIPYGTSAINLADRLRIPLAEGEKLISDWYNTMTVAGAWIKAKRAYIKVDSTAISPLGRRRRLGLVTDQSLSHLQNEAVNFPIQSTASDFTMLSGRHILQKLREAGLDHEIKLVNIVHDAICIELPRDKLAYVARLVVGSMAYIPSKYFAQIPFVAEAEWSVTGWGNKEKIDMDELDALQARVLADSPAELIAKKSNLEITAELEASDNINFASFESNSEDDEDEKSTD